MSEFRFFSLMRLMVVCLVFAIDIFFMLAAVL